MLSGFKDFMMKGNVLDMAVGVIMATAFGAVVSSFTSDVMMPPIGALLGGVDFTELGYVWQPAVMNDAGEVVKEAVKIGWGKFLQKLIDFLIIGAVIYSIVKAYNASKEAEEAAPAGPTQEELLAEIRDALRNP